MPAALLLIGLLLPAPAPTPAAARPLTYVLVHGAWGGAWDWREVDARLTASGHRVRRVQLTGLGEREHLASPAIGLDTHVLDVVNAIVWEELQDVVLVGHSYGGMVVTGAADRIPGRIRRLVYVDAFVPEKGESMLDLAYPALAELVRKGTREGMVMQGGFRPDRSPPRDSPQPLKTLTDKLALFDEAALRRIPGTYILTVAPGRSNDEFDAQAERARRRGFTVLRMTADHVPERSAPGPLVELLRAVP